MSVITATIKDFGSLPISNWVTATEQFMKPAAIQVGKTYCNRGAGRTRRTVLEISDKLKINWYGSGPRPDEPVVRYAQNGTENTLYLSSFASWCGKECSDQ